MNKRNEIYYTIAKRVREERKKINLTQEELAEKLDVTCKFLGNIERNIDNPSLWILIRLAEIFNIPVKSLFEDKDGAENIKVKKSENKITEEDKQLLFLYHSLSPKQKKYIINTIREIKKLSK